MLTGLARAVAFVAVTSLSESAPAAAPSAAADFAGCYRLSFSWVPAWKEGDGAWFMPPAHLHLSRQAAAEPGRYRVVPDDDPAIGGKKMLLADWTLESNVVVVRWSNGFAGVTLRMRRVKGHLQGTAQTGYDVGTPESGSVLAQPVKCNK